MLFDCHMHTHLCGHAHGRPEEYVKKARKLGIRLVTFTCHIPMDGKGFLQEGIRMNRSHLPDYKKQVERAREHGDSLGVRVLYGIEAEVFPEENRLTSMREILNEESFDFVLGSLHHQLPSYRRHLYSLGQTTDSNIIESYFQDLANGAATGLYHSMSHPDVIRIYGSVNSFVPAEHQEIIERFLKTLVENEVCMEVNTSGLAKGVYQVHPDPLILKWAHDLDVRITIGSDSHHPDHVGRFFPEVIAQLKKIGFRAISYFEKGHRIDVSMQEILP